MNGELKPQEKSNDDLQKVVKVQPLGDILKEWATPKTVKQHRSETYDYCNKCRSQP